MNEQPLVSRNDLETWAGYLLDYGLGGITPEDVVMIKGEHVTWPLMSVLQDRIFASGAVADVFLVPPDNDRGRVWGASAARFGTPAQIARVPVWQQSRYDSFTKYIEILGAENPSLYAGLPEENLRALMVADEPLKSTRLAKPWLLTLYPTQGFADLEGLTLKEYASVVVGASTMDPRQLEALEEPVYQVLQSARTARVITRHPDGRELSLTLRLPAPNVIKCTGHRNFPDGEVYTSPDASSAEGEIFVDLPVSYAGTVIQGIHLVFREGRIVSFSAMKGEEALRGIIGTDEGSHRLGELAFGMNTGMARALMHPLFIEKVGGTLHIAIGASYEGCFVNDPHSPEGMARVEELVREGVLNRSAQHVDIVTDFRPGGSGVAVYLDEARLTVEEKNWKV